MNWTLEVVVVPVSDVDRAKTFYADQLGFNVTTTPRSAKGSGSFSSHLRVGLLDRTPTPQSDPLDDVGFVF
jgi:catechol 2,3-dioxygenase-like lactoylglutathione lyase family enzyme